VKLIETGTDSFTFELGDREKRLLFLILRLYPVIPLDHQRLSRGETRAEDHQMLRDALSAQRTSNRRQIEELISADGVLVGGAKGWKLTLMSTQMEAVLQALNDVRVGSWLLLGSPEDLTGILDTLKEENATHFWAMEVSGQFQMNLLHALSGDGGEDSPPPPPKET
jgi:hypothetical protein